MDVLVLTRRAEQTIVATTPSGERVEFVVMEFRPGPRVKIGVVAAKDVIVDRGEIDDLKRGQAS